MAVEYFSHTINLIENAISETYDLCKLLANELCLNEEKQPPPYYRVIYVTLTNVFWEYLKNW